MRGGARVGPHAILGAVKSYARVAVESQSASHGATLTGGRAIDRHFLPQHAFRPWRVMAASMPYHAYSPMKYGAQRPLGVPTRHALDNSLIDVCAQLAANKKPSSSLDSLLIISCYECAPPKLALARGCAYCTCSRTDLLSASHSQACDDA